MHELEISRRIAAPPETVYRTWTGRLRDWWAPRPWTVPAAEQDYRPGGRSFVVMRSPEGEDMPYEGVFLDVVPNEKIVLTNAFKAGWEPQDPFMVAIFTFEPDGGGTLYRARVRHWSEEQLKQHEQMGFHTGWALCAAQLAELAEAEI
ncbi:MAG TPA: SRPBCC family protein [Allosphingosinicella sp.]|nr:SRPBCC family protein [Allosphingosinicella sp.]